MKKCVWVLSVLIITILFLSNFTIKMDSAKPYHSSAELASFDFVAQSPIGPGQYFQPSFSCQGCHGSDTLGLANIDENGMDVNLFDHWESSMMAFAAKDPLWRAKVSHEILVNPPHALGLQTKCTSCHAPMGHYTAIYGGATSYTISDLVNDSLGLDGVSCAGCHTIGPGAGSTFSGITDYDTTRVIYGPFPGPMTGPMQLYEGYTPTYSPHMDNSAVCSSCHTLMSETVDLAGNYTGGEFIEQATYHEYLNSSYPQANTKCQTCHMPQLPDPIIIANGYSSLVGRTPFNQHVFAGANHFMLDLIKNNKAALDILVDDTHIDSTMAATLRLLQQQSVVFELSTESITSDTAYFQVKIRNKAGHKFPSGYPSRRAVLQFIVKNSTNDTIFQSGIFDPDYRVIGENAQFEAHHSEISENNVNQIYEMVMGDVNGQFTSLLERAAIVLKDNRIPPDGFTTSASMYDTVKISADALADDDFNKISGVEGSGTDIVHFKVPVNGVTGSITISSGLYYQSVPPKWVDEMFAMSSAPIDSFEVMYQSANQTPVLVSGDTLTEVLSGIASAQQTNEFHIWPTVSHDGIVNVTSTGKSQSWQMKVYNPAGQIVFTKTMNAGTVKEQVLLPVKNGVYFIRISSGKHTETTKILVL